ncbi:hypothetical protein [Sphingobium sp. SCG-1]|uniref:hypothetical protein n=1 Tax=Sphingobium sp. SCG-1 TaxID=2072936 RepID=UPI00166FA4F3|nr:hypothetical protein [Sphingobium sp. SCG-1]
MARVPTNGRHPAMFLAGFLTNATSGESIVVAIAPRLSPRAAWLQALAASLWCPRRVFGTFAAERVDEPIRWLVGLHLR